MWIENGSTIISLIPVDAKNSGHECNDEKKHKQQQPKPASRPKCNIFLLIFERSANTTSFPTPLVLAQLISFIFER